MEGKGNSRFYEIAFTESGVHRLSVNAFGKTINGREFRLVLPEFSFNADSKEGLLMPSLDDDVVIPNQENTDTTLADKINVAEENARQLAMELEEAKIAQKIAAKEKEQQTYMIIGAANVGIVLIALVVYFISRRKKKK